MRISCVSGKQAQVRIFFDYFNNEKVYISIKFKIHPLKNFPFHFIRVSKKMILTNPIQTLPIFKVISIFFQKRT